MSPLHMALVLLGLAASVGLTLYALGMLYVLDKRSRS